MNKILNEHEKLFADENKNMVYSYLKINHLPYDEFYDVIIFGYLRAVKKYLNRPELRQYKFITIAFDAMDTEVGNYHRANNCKKRKCIKLSLDAALFRDGLPLTEIIPAPEPEIDIQKVANQNLLKEMFSHVNSMEREIWELKARGYTYKEIAGFCQISVGYASTSMSNVRKRLKELFPDMCR